MSGSYRRPNRRNRSRSESPNLENRSRSRSPLEEIRPRHRSSNEETGLRSGSSNEETGSRTGSSNEENRSRSLNLENCSNVENKLDLVGQDTCSARSDPVTHLNRLEEANKSLNQIENNNSDHGQTIHKSLYQAPQATAASDAAMAMLTMTNVLERLDHVAVDIVSEIQDRLTNELFDLIQISLEHLEELVKRSQDSEISDAIANIQRFLHDKFDEVLCYIVDATNEEVDNGCSELREAVMSAFYASLQFNLPENQTDAEDIKISVENNELMREASQQLRLFTNEEVSQANQYRTLTMDNQTDCSNSVNNSFQYHIVDTNCNQLPVETNINQTDLPNRPRQDATVDSLSSFAANLEPSSSQSLLPNIYTSITANVNDEEMVEQLNLDHNEKSEKNRNKQDEKNSR